MGIFTLLAIFVPLVTVTAIWEGTLYLCERARERREWKRLKAYYYPNGEWCRTGIDVDNEWAGDAY